MSLSCPMRVALLLTVLLLSSASVRAASLAEIKQRGFMVVDVAAESTVFPAAQNDQAQGFDADLRQKLGAAAAVPLHIQVVPMASLAADLLSGEADLAASSLDITLERQKSLAFGPPLAETTLYYLKRKSDDRIGTVASLDGRRFGILTGSAEIMQLAEVEHTLAKAKGRLGENVAYGTLNDAYRDLASGKIDYVIGPLTDLTAATKNASDAFALGQPVAHRTFAAWAVAKGDDDLAAFLKDFALKERANGDLAAAQQKWLGESIKDLPIDGGAEDWWAAREDRPAVLPIPTLRDPD